MRHISFDESTVLNELVKIAHKDGLVKVAQEEAPAPIPGQPAPPAVPMQKKEHVDIKEISKVVQLPKVLNMLVSNSLPVRRRKIQELYTGLLYAAAGYVSQYHNAAGLKPGLPSASKVAEYFAKFIADHVNSKYGANVNQNQIANSILGAKSAEKENDMVKSAEGDKYYDITGETGEQLIEKAHPGGGTRTELTHSKTDENLVETIVEQQKKDLEVARSVPKGTYAKLMNLYGVLTKMGHKERLSGLKVIIKAVATPEEVIEHTLVDLADKLDDLGLGKSADTVDSLGKKKVAVSPGHDNWQAEQQAQQIKLQEAKRAKLQELIGNVQNSLVQLSPEIRQSSHPAKNEIGQLAKDLQNIARRNPDIDVTRVLSALIPRVNAFSTEAKYALQTFIPGIDISTPASITQAPSGGVAGDLPLRPIPPRTKKEKRRANWKKYYNSALSKIPAAIRKAKGLKRIRFEDGVPDDRDFRRALKSVRDTGIKTTLSDWAEFMSGTGKPGEMSFVGPPASTAPPLPPPPPPPPVPPETPAPIKEGPEGLPWPKGDSPAAQKQRWRSSAHINNVIRRFVSRNSISPSMYGEIKNKIIKHLNEDKSIDEALRIIQRSLVKAP